MRVHLSGSPFPGPAALRQRTRRACFQQIGQDDSVTRASLDKQPQDVAAMFDGVARRYDLTNTVLSGGLDRGWRRATGEALALRPGDTVLDLAAGTAVSTVQLGSSGATAVACDFSLGMLKAGKARGRSVPLVAGDALALPFRDGAFDAVTISFGLRNVGDTAAALAEMRRVTRHGGRLVVCEFSHPTWAPWRRVYTEYLMRALPTVARRVSSSPDSYVYLAESIRAWPDQEGLADLIAEAGWQRPEWRNLSGGIVALHRATAR
jgi:demethylmenaquinone methyltransferase / 2-methoxy-6-polyprenyl-1,4-benzoquinol methylase